MSQSVAEPALVELFGHAERAEREGVPPHVAADRMAGDRPRAAA